MVSSTVGVGHYDLCNENLQSVALNLAVKATGLGHYLNGDLHDFPILNNNKNWFSTPVLTRLAETISAAKRFLAWLDRPPFRSIKDFQVVREEVLQNALTLTQGTGQKTLSETCQELKDICDSLVKKATDPLVIQTAYVEIVTLKKNKPDEELGFELTTPAGDGTHLILTSTNATPALRRVIPGDEVLQVNYQTVVGWEHKKVIQALIANPIEVVLTLKKRPKNLNQAGQLVRPSGHTFQTGGLASLPRRKHSNNSLKPPATKDDLYLKTLETQSESETKTPPLQTQQSHSDSEPPEPQNKLLRLHRCPTMGEAVLRRPTAKKSKESSGESRPRSLPLDTLHLDNISSEDLRHWLERQAKESEPHGHSAEQLSPRETPKLKKTVRIQLDLNGNSTEKSEKKKPDKGEWFYSETEISLKLPQKTTVAKEDDMAGNEETAKRDVEEVGSDASPKRDSRRSRPERVSSGSRKDVSNEKGESNATVVNRKDLTNVRDKSKTSSGSSSEGFIIWEEVEDEKPPSKTPSPEKVTPAVGYQERAIDVPEDFVAQPKYRINPSYQDTKVVRRSPKVRKARKKARISRRITCVDLGPGSCEGWLNKRNDGLKKSWVKMFFKLKEFVLYYYKSTEAEKAKGVICLPGYNIQKSDKKKWAIKISHRNLDKDVYLEAEKESDWQKWMEHLQLAAILFKNEEKVRNSMVFSDNMSMLSTVMEDITGYHSESDDADSPVPQRSPRHREIQGESNIIINVENFDEEPDEFAQQICEIAPEASVFGKTSLARRSTRRNRWQNARKIYKMQTEYHPNQSINEKLISKHVLHRTIESKKKDVDELDKLLAQKINSQTFHTWQRDHPNLLQEIKRTKLHSQDARDFSSDEEGSVVSNNSDLGAVGMSPSTSRKSANSPVKGARGSDKEKKTKEEGERERRRIRTESEGSETSV
ncbi:connector enhancer of kinase suppressor of ras 2-like isoform X3 [Apostichopus japonicus]|uniref:connector enhancer of kinase suppressor of ras 2-like isoform X3 n=1 Tax=Stichopus japonicus TaxID=307972 RepID=UPI003AB8A31F